MVCSHSSTHTTVGDPRGGEERRDAAVRAGVLSLPARASVHTGGVGQPCVGTGLVWVGHVEEADTSPSTAGGVTPTLPVEVAIQLHGPQAVGRLYPVVPAGAIRAKVAAGADWVVLTRATKAHAASRVDAVSLQG